jgi:hypothetical protein
MLSIKFHKFLRIGIGKIHSTQNRRELMKRIFSEASEAKYYYNKTSENGKLYVELAKLFGHLQYDKWGWDSSTEGFTKALGWTRKETGQQCDAHTVFRDILTALQGPPSSSRSKLISDIFQSVQIGEEAKC